MNELIKTIVRSLFGPKVLYFHFFLFVHSGNSSKGKMHRLIQFPSDVLVELAVHLTAHGLENAIAELYSVLFSGSFFDNLVAVKALNKIFDKKNHFFTSAYCLKFDEPQAKDSFEVFLFPLNI